MTVTVRTVHILCTHHCVQLSYTTRKQGTIPIIFSLNLQTNIIAQTLLIGEERVSIQKIKRV